MLLNKIQHNFVNLKPFKSKTIFPVLTFLAILITTGFKEKPVNASKPRVDKNWSIYHGYMNWYAAKSKCELIGMRLPTINELKTSFASGSTKEWQKDGYDYWSSTPVGDDYYILGVDDGGVYDDSPNESNHVRCHK